MINDDAMFTAISCNGLCTSGGICTNKMVDNKKISYCKCNNGFSGFDCRYSNHIYLSNMYLLIIHKILLVK